MITDHEQRQLEARRRLLGSWDVDLEDSDLAPPLDASQASKTSYDRSYGRTALTVKPKPSLRRERPKTEIEFVLMSGFGSGE